MRVLAIDIGNTNIKRAFLENGLPEQVLTTPTAELDSVLDEISNSLVPIGVATVRAGTAEKIRKALDKRGAPPAVEVNAGVEKPVTGFYAGMGADRIADLAAAYTRYGGKTYLAVVGLGTGTTITVVSTEGRFVGGYTTLGLGPICRTISAAIPALPPIDPASAATLNPGQSVVDALTRGTVSAHVGIVEKWVGLVKAQFGSDLFVVATGGWNQLISQLTDCINVCDSNLTLKGIATITEMSLAPISRP